MSNLKRFLALTLAMLMVVGAMVTVSAKSFEDVAATDSYAEAVDVLSELGVIAGTSADEFSPETLVERQQMAMFIARLATAQPALFAGSAGAVFADQTAPVYNAAIAYANSNGFVKGTSATTFNGAASVTLQEAATMLSRVLGYGNKTNDATYPYSYMVLANEIGLLKGLEDVAPTAALTRGEVATMLYNALFAPKAERELLYTPDGQDWIVSIPETFYKDVIVGTVTYEKGSFDKIITKAWKATVVDGAYIDATLKAGIEKVPTTATKAIADPVRFNKGIATNTSISFSSLVKYFDEDVTADDMLGVELKLIIRNGTILKLEVVGSKSVSTNASYDKATNILTVNGESFNLSNYLSSADKYPADTDNCFYVYSNNRIDRKLFADADAVDTYFARIADGFFTFDVINEGLATQKLVFKPMNFGKVVDDAGKLKVDSNLITTLNGAVKDDYVAYFNGGNLNVDVYAKAVKSTASKAVKINSAANTATLADGTVVPTGGTSVTGATLGTIKLNEEFHVYTVDGKIISSVVKDGPAETYVPKNYYKVVAIDTSALRDTNRIKVVSNTGAISTIAIAKIDAVEQNTAAFDTAYAALVGKIITVDGTTIFTSATTDKNYFAEYKGTLDVSTALTIPEITSDLSPANNILTIGGQQFVLTDNTKIVVKSTTAGTYATHSGRILGGFKATQTLSNAVAVYRLNAVGLKELAYLYADSTAAVASDVFKGASSVVSSNLYLFISKNEETADYIKYKAFKLSTGAIEEVTYAKAASSIGASSKVYDVKSSDSTPAVYAYAKETTFKLADGFVVEADGTVYSSVGVKYFMWNNAADKQIFEAKKLVDDLAIGKAYTGTIVTNSDATKVEYVIVKDSAKASATSIKAETGAAAGEIAITVTDLAPATAKIMVAFKLSTDSTYSTYNDATAAKKITGLDSTKKYDVKVKLVAEGYVDTEIEVKEVTPKA